ncbi:hypothetical protein ETAA1_30720 [Urbifossiella limnaea]|uniref:Uncharacterized protein n=1 Tax=Urbifossiella limnaea TaxID=2528023 RepID=A0A517XUC5_9BACT|nr:hypothetical protein ETAA1_30720 [Urbifossiella limnaea]
MTDGGPRGRVKLGELADAVLADVDPVVHAGFVADLALVTRTEEAVTAVADRFLAEGDRGRLVFLEWLTRLRVRIPEAVRPQVLTVLGDSRLPDDLRVRAAARALRSGRTSRSLLISVVESLTAGLSPLDSLARLRAVQARLRRSKALDALIDRRERRLRLTCPRCTARLGLAAMARHLFETHGLILDRGRARRPETLAKARRKRYAAARDTTALDEAAALSTAAALRAWAARTRPAPSDVPSLLDDAAGRGCGLCPRCFAERPPSVSPLPPPLTLADGRLCGDGYAVEVSGPDGLRTCTVTTPAGVVRSGLDGRRAIGPRAVGVAAAAAVLVVGGVLSLPVTVVVGLSVTSYLAARVLRGPMATAGERAVDRAWSDLVPRIRPGPAFDHFLTRLCRVSAGHPNTEARAGHLSEPRDLAARAAARFLQAEDAARHGVDRTGAIGDLLSAGLRGDAGVTFAEYVTELFLAGRPSPGAVARLRVLALDGAFAAGFTPRGLTDVWAACPNFRALTDVVPLSRLGVQYGVWDWTKQPPWESVAGTGTVFELARVAPTLAGRLLHEHPDLLLYHRPPQAVDEAHGWVLVTARGVVVGGKLVADPDAELRVEGGRLVGSATLVFGPHRLALPRRPPATFLTTLRQLLRVRAEQLLPRLDVALAPGPTHPALASLANRCGCGAGVFITPGRVGRVARFGPT